MPDISMCTNEECPWRNGCYRYRAVPNIPRQSYMDFNFEDGNCKDFWPLEPGQHLNPKPTKKDE